MYLPFQLGKVTYWEGGIRGAGFILGAGIEKTGYVSSELMHCVDWMPSLLTAAKRGATGDPTAYHTITIGWQPSFSL